MLKSKSYGICLYVQENGSLKILLGKSFGKNKWGLLKGVKEFGETPKQTAQREFFEESGIFVESVFFGEYFEQINLDKDIGVFLVNGFDVPNLNRYFDKHRLKEVYQTCENEDVKFFDIKMLPPIKSKQKKLITEVIAVLNTY
jgi:8-oxo-dGTP pyrophosphatase MutT (NUDIX family)